MIDDLIDRLRYEDDPLMTRAADEIERLRAELLECQKDLGIVPRDAEWAA